MRASARSRRSCSRLRTDAREYPCKRYPAMFISSRAGSGRALRSVFRKRLSPVRMRDVMDVEPPRDVVGIPALSGACHALVKRAAIDSTGGFDRIYFLLRGDFD